MGERKYKFTVDTIPTYPIFSTVAHIGINNNIMSKISVLILILFISLKSVDSFAKWMTEDFCDRKLEVGEVL